MEEGDQKIRVCRVTRIEEGVPEVEMEDGETRPPEGCSQGAPAEGDVSGGSVPSEATEFSHGIPVVGWDEQKRVITPKPIIRSSSVQENATEFVSDSECAKGDTEMEYQKRYHGSPESLESRQQGGKGLRDDGSSEQSRAAEFANIPHTEEGDERHKLPEYLRNLFEETRKRLASAQAQKVLAVLLRYQAVFAATDLDIGRFTALVHYIKTGTAFPIKQRMRRSLLGFEKEEKKTIDSILNAGVIEPSQSEWASPPVLDRKKDGWWRYCIDFKAVNNETLKDAYPLPVIEECMDSLAGKKYFCTLDMNSGYWQIPVAKEEKEKTAFIARHGLYHFTRMPFGLSNSPPTFQRAMHLVLSGLIWDIVIVYWTI